MIRMNPIFAVPAVATLLALSAGAALAAQTQPSHSSAAPSAPGPNGGQQVLRGDNCSFRADQLGLASPAWQTYVDRCQKLGVF